MVSLTAVSISVLVGLLMANGLPRRAGMKRRLLPVHEATALAGLVAIAIHGITLLGDRFLHPTLANIAVPFTMSYRPGFTGMGIIAGWLAAGLGLSFYARRRIGAKLWRRMHRWTVAVWGLGVVHTLGAGTDAGATWLRALLLATGVPIALLFLRRVLPGGSRAPRPAARAATARPDVALAAGDARR